MSIALPQCTESERRRRLIEAIGQDGPQETSPNGIDHIEVISLNSQGLLRLHFFTAKGIEALEAENILIRGRRPTPVKVSKVAPAQDPQNGTDQPICQVDRKNALDVFVQGLRESETYTLELVKSDGECRTHETPDDFDPRHAKVRFAWRTKPHTDVDFRPLDVPAAAVRPDAQIDYLAKDYASFRRLLLDRLAQIMPDWRQRNPADVGITLVELLAWVGDRLSYQQDAVGNEAYLGTARQRISVRRHARLVDYRMHEGCNARVLMQIQIDAAKTEEPGDGAAGKRGLELDLIRLQFCTMPGSEFRSLAKSDAGVIHAGDVQQNERFFDTVQIFQPLEQPPRRTTLTVCDLIDVKQIVKRLARASSGKPDQPCGSQHNALQKIWQELRIQSEITTVAAALEDNGVSESFEAKLVAEFNRLIAEERLHEDPEDAQPTDELLALAACHAENADFERQNRELLDDVFCEELSPLGSKLVLDAAHNEIHFYTWDEDECWLAEGATSATLRDELVTRPASSEPPGHGCANEGPAQPANTAGPKVRALQLSVGDILIFEEAKGPKTGSRADANPALRHAVRLTRVCRETDHVPAPPIEVLEIEWAQEDALPFPLCLSSVTSQPECCRTSNITVARGNIIVADHGRTVAEPYDAADRFVVRGSVRQLDCGSSVDLPTRVVESERFEPWLSHSGLTFAQPLRRVAASRLFEQDVQAAEPAIRLTRIPGNSDGTPAAEALARELSRGAVDLLKLKPLEALLPPPVAYWFAAHVDTLVNRKNAGLQDLNTQAKLRDCVVALLRQATHWEPRFDLVDSLAADRHFVVEMDNQRRAHLRFGDGRLGLGPAAGDRFFAEYRVGHGMAGNVGAEALRFVILKEGPGDLESRIKLVRNPLAAVGGREPQSIREVKLLAPHAYRHDQPRAITADDYNRIVRREFRGEVQDARALVAKAGAGYLVTVAIDPLDSVRQSDQLLERVRQSLHRVRGIGHQVQVAWVDYVPLDIEMKVTVNPAWRRSHVLREISELFSNRRLPGGRLGLFHPDRLTFGSDIYGSQLTAAAQEIEGVDGVELKRLQRMGDAPADPPPQVLRIDPLQIARLDNNGNEEHGRLCLNLAGGQ